MRQIDWYFDFISPYSYLASESLQRLPVDIELRPCPILFAGLLQHWHTKGPAEIAPMRRFTFRQVQWLADKHDIPLKLPPQHPFNPLKLLRLCIALGNETVTAQRLFRFVWAEGGSCDDANGWRQLTSELEIDDVESCLAAPEVKQSLRENTEQAIEKGVFGVPAFVVDGEIFWGFDSLDFLLAYLQDSSVLQSSAMRAADAMPEGPGRQR